jgi:hypothetical protein
VCGWENGKKTKRKDGRTDTGEGGRDVTEVFIDVDI